MEQFSYMLDEKTNLQSCVNDFQQKCPKSYSSLLVTIFPHGNDKEKIREAIKTVSEALPNATIVGSTNSGGIALGELTIDHAVITFMVFQDTNLKVITYDGKKIANENASQQFLDECGQMEDLVGIELIAVPRYFDAHSFFEDLNELPEEIAFFGGNADTFDMSVPSYLFTRDEILGAGILAVCFCSKTLKIHVDSVFGWKPLGTSMKITSTDGKKIIRELDGKPAFSVYEKYLQIVPGDHFHQDTLEFPLVLERDGDTLARLPDSCREDGALVLNADCSQGETVRLAYGDFNEILHSTQVMQEAIAEHIPEGILIFNCVSRITFLQDNSWLELAHYNHIAPHAGIYTHGEYDRVNGRIRMLNMTLVSASFREGEIPDGKKPAHLPELISMNENLSLVQRLARFINIASKEIEAANKQLKSLAEQDRLTRVFNRGEIENIFKYHLDEQREHLSAVMIDLDNFKSVNDTFGHETGDRVLINTAKCLSTAVRASDAVGRWGGEEFLVILPDVPLETAILVADRLRKRLESQPPLADGRRTTASMGVAEVQSDEDYINFYKRLDANLYTAKKNGKNQVVG